MGGVLGLPVWPFVSALFFVNAAAILNEDRFLAKRGWVKGVQHDFGAAKASYRGQALDFINAVSYLRMPLTFVNAFVIIIKLVFG